MMQKITEYEVKVRVNLAFVRANKIKSLAGLTEVGNYDRYRK